MRGGNGGAGFCFFFFYFPPLKPRYVLWSGASYSPKNMVVVSYEKPLILSEHLPCARNCDNCFIQVDSFSILINLMRLLFLNTL